MRATLALLLLAPALAALGGRMGVAAQDAPTITMWFDTTGGSTAADCVNAAAIEPYNERGGTQVEATLQANNWPATQTAVAGGAGPDVVTTPGPSFAFEMAQAGQLLALDEIAAQMGWSESFVPWALNLGIVDGQLFSIPNEIETLVLYYNKTLFEEHGWETPTTLAELTALAEQIDAAGIIPFAHANQEWRQTNEWFVGEFLNHSAGGPQAVYNALTGAGSWTDPAFVEALTLLDQYQQNGWFMGGLDRYYTTTDADRDVTFADGEAAMKIEGTWWVGDSGLYFGEEAGNDSEWDWVPVPSASGEAIFDLGIGSTYSINARTEHPEAVAEFLSYYFSPETQATLAVQCGSAPAPVAIPPESLSGLDPRHAGMLGALNEASAANNYGYTTWTFWPPKSDVYIYEEIEKVWAGDMTIEEYLQGLQTLFDEEAAAGDIPPIPQR
jgi:raffinose/stachyose/melibiose transport system substrate-binding protein